MVAAAAVVEVRYQLRDRAFGIYVVPTFGWPRLLEGGIATLEAAETRRLELDVDAIAAAAVLEHLRRCAEGEGGRARLAIEGYANADTAGYFAREAARYGAAALELEAGAR